MSTAFHAGDDTVMKHVLLIVSGEQKGQRFMLAEGASFVVGRDDRCCVRLSPRDRRASRRHARFEVSDARLLVTDLDSKNGTFVDGERVARLELEQGQHVSCGQTVIRVETSPDPDRTITQVLDRQTRIVLRDTEREAAIASPTLLERLVPAGIRGLFD